MSGLPETLKRGGAKEMRDALDAALKRRGEWVTPAAYNERHYQYRDSVAEPVTCE